mmetsp:Transcript_90370/g.269627  ORF Transcript_90370/g.269627 Transcript_90370/m.269627 type:complete len:228 (+) Transcript_90370:235-918(+)
MRIGDHGGNHGGDAAGGREPGLVRAADRHVPQGPACAELHHGIAGVRLHRGHRRLDAPSSRSNRHGLFAPGGDLPEGAARSFLDPAVRSVLAHGGHDQVRRTGGKGLGLSGVGGREVAEGTASVTLHSSLRRVFPQRPGHRLDSTGALRVRDTLGVLRQAAQGADGGSLHVRDVGMGRHGSEYGLDAARLPQALGAVLRVRRHDVAQRGDVVPHGVGMACLRPQCRC